ncbi:hypothetical protein [Streptosporangium sp. NPDC051022]|uniref:hypothetical protein n=1 Tax=Streptosporangium sp. NPDC051022 TaxID=3155752 RepID=UPI0034318915
MTFRLPRGATGFRDAGEPSAEPMDRREFARVVHAVARRTNGGVLAVDHAETVRSFRSAVLVHRDRKVEVVGHLLLPFLALARPGEEGDMTVSFLDDPDVARALGELGELGGCGPYRLLSVAELTLSTSRADLSELAAVELEQLRYWNPGTVGEVLFNHWD